MDLVDDDGSGLRGRGEREEFGEFVVFISFYWSVVKILVYLF